MEFLVVFLVMLIVAAFLFSRGPTRGNRDRRF